VTAETQRERDNKRRASNWLPPYVRGLVWQYADKGMAYADIANELGVQPEAVRRVLSGTVSAQEEQQT